MTVADFVSRPRGTSEEVDGRARSILDDDGYAAAHRVITRWAGYAPSPVVECADIAQRLGVAAVLVKDESQRLGLKSFKSLGGAYAVHRAYQRWQDEGGRGEFVVTCVTDGNHGLSVASGAQSLGLRCVIYLPDVVTEKREQAIAAFGAEVVRRPGSYDDVTRDNARDAATYGWTIVTDTSSTEIENQSVTDVMQGYRVLAQEIVDAWDTLRPTHIVLQAGCGGMAGAVVGHLLTRMGLRELPTVVVVEPENAACLTESARAGEPAVVTGALDTLMAGLSVGEISLAAWEILKDSADHYVAVSDENVAPAMRLLGTPETERPAVVSGETGAAGLAAVLSLAQDRDHFQAVGLGAGSRVLLINTEGDTDPELYQQIMAEGRATV